MRETVVGLSLLFVGCVPKPVATLDQPFALGIGEPMRVDALTVTIGEVLEDSRCPTHAQCVWEGRTRLALTVSTRQQTTEGEVALPGDAFTTQGYVVHLTDVAPAPSVEPPAPHAYRATLVVRQADK
ncbi:MAG: hypothetical protein AAGA48_11280 [Myxococcota bacterium]